MSLSLLSLSLLPQTPAQAQNGYPGGGGGYPGGGGQAHWTITYQCSGTMTSTDGSSTSTSAWPTSEAPTDANNTFSLSVTAYELTGIPADLSVQLSGMVTPIATWTPGYSGDTTPPPTQAVFLEEPEAEAMAYQHAEVYIDMAASTDDGYGDYLYGNPFLSEGNHVVEVPNPHRQTMLTLPTLSMMAQGSVSASNNIYGLPIEADLYLSTVPFAASLIGNSTVDGTGYDPNNPNYFSGTECSTTAQAVAVTGSIANAQLSIGGTVVKEYYDTSDAPNPLPPPAPNQPIISTGTSQPSIALSAYFDSTHFPDSDSISITLNVTDKQGNSYSLDLAAPATNNFLSYSNLSWIDPNTGQNVSVNEIAGLPQDVNNPQAPDYQPYAGLNQQATNCNYNSLPYGHLYKQDVINEIGDAPGTDSPAWTAFFPATHSDPGVLGDSYSTSEPPNAPTSGPADFLDDTDIQNAVKAKSSSTDPEPYLFVYLPGCGASSSSSIAADFGIPQSATNDVGFLGNDATIAVCQHNATNAVETLHFLFAGETLLEAMSDAAQLFPIWAYQGPYTPPGPSETTFATPYGDSSMTLHNRVHGAAGAGPLGQWFE